MRLFNLENVIKNILIKFNINKILIRNHIRQFSDLIDEPHRRIVLDIGGGKSPYQRFFASSLYVSVDISASSKTNILGDINMLSIKDDSIDVVICTEVLEHIENPQKALGEIKRVLKQGHCLIITTPFVWGIHDTIDFYRWTRTGIVNLLGNYNFEICNLERRGGIGSVIGAIILNLPFRLFFSKDTQHTQIRKLLIVPFVFLLLPFGYFFRIIDLFDKRGEFTLGWDILCKLRQSK